MTGRLMSATRRSEPKVSKAVLRVNLPIEEDASKIYTRSMFEQFGQNMYHAGA